MKNKTNSKFRMIFMIILLLLLIVPLGIVCYDKLINKEKPPVPTPSDVNNEASDTITSLKMIDITEYDQLVSVDGKDFKLKKEITVDGAFLIINDKVVELENNESVYADFAHVTNKFIIFTLIGQDGEIISYAIDKDGKQITVNDKEYQMQDITLVDGTIKAKGHIFCGLDGDCPDKDLIIKYENNTINVVAE